MLLAIPFLGNAQLKGKDLVGTWTTCNDDSVYFKSDTVILYQDINHRSKQENPCCYNINWNVKSKRKIKIENLFACTEPGRIRTHEGRETFKVLKGASQKIQIKRSGREIDKFRVVDFEVREVDRYPHEIKILTLKRE